MLINAPMLSHLLEDTMPYIGQAYRGGSMVLGAEASPQVRSRKHKYDRFSHIMAWYRLVGGFNGQKMVWIYFTGPGELYYVYKSN